MDIGTAKPTHDERARVPHHLVDIADPEETVGLAQFLKLARVAISAIHERGMCPFLVGGTGQYVRALLRGWQVPNVPPDPELRADLEALGERDPGALWDRLLELDPKATTFIHPNNLRRIIRALEVTLKMERPFSELRRRKPPPYRVLQIGLTMDRDALYERADARVDAMMEAGLLEEVRGLLEAGYTWEMPAMSALGYQQFRPYFEGVASLEEIVERIKLDTHDFIRRQYTWFRPTASDIHWLDATQSPAEAARALLRDFLG
jgi:tRNA dimethylallyltransferase